MKDKFCKLCLEKLSINNFWKQPNNKDGYFGKCKKCCLKLVDTNTLKKQTLLKDNIWACTGCKKELSLTKENFHKDRTTTTGFKNRCKTCSKQARLFFSRMKDSDSLNYYIKEIIHGARRRAKIKKIKFELSLDVIKNLWDFQKGNCAISGVSMTHIILKGRLYTNLSIDRIDSTKGYELDNIQLVCVAVNIMKNTLSMVEFISFCELIIKNNKNNDEK